MKDPGTLKESHVTAHTKVSLSSLKDFLAQARELFLSVDGEGGSTSVVLDELIQRLDDQKFHLAVLGQFKRGKSTVINALVGANLLPTSVLPLTAVPTLIEFGKRLEVSVYYAGDTGSENYTPEDVTEACSLLSELVTEKGNPKNTRGIERVVVRTPCALLKHQVVLIDTPGIGSTNLHNTVTTTDFLAQCDAAIFVVSADPPLTEQEAEFLSQVRKHVAKMFFVMNKVDYLQEGQLQEAIGFFERTLSETCQVCDPGPVFCVSAYKALEARLAGDDEAFFASGMDALEQHLEDFLLGEKALVLFDAIFARAREVVSIGLMQLELRLRSIKMPLEQLERCLEVFDEKLVEIHRERQIADDRLDGDERRATAFLESEIEKLRKRTNEHLRTVLDGVFELMDHDQVSESHLSDSLEAQVPVYFHKALVELAGEISSHIQEVLDDRRKEADNLILAVRKTAADIFDIPYRAPSGASMFKIDTRIYWDTHKWTPSYSPIPEGSLDRLLPARQRRKRLERRWYRQVEALVEQNSETLRWELLQGMKKAFWSYKTSLDRRLRDTLDATRGAIRSALEKRKSQQQQVAKTVDNIEQTIGELRSWINSQP